MVDRIAGPPFVPQLGENQTQKLLRRIRESFGADTAAIKTPEGVVLMTLENIQ